MARHIYNRGSVLFKCNRLVAPNRYHRSLTTNAEASRNSIKGEEVKIPTPWGHIAGIWWGPRDSLPLIALHGWQDNAHSWLPLQPLLSPDLSILALDFPGHGKSSHFPPGMFYEYSDNIIAIKKVVKYFNWESVSLLGHSMGAITAFTYAAFFPQEVKSVIQLDNLKPITLLRKDEAERTARNIDALLQADERNISGSEPPSYIYEELIERLYHGNGKSIDKDKCHHLLDRGITPSKIDSNKYYFTRDSKLKNILWKSPSQDFVRSLALRITCPLAFIKFEQGEYFEPKENFDDIFNIIKSNNKNFEHHTVPGTHHAHVNNPESVAPLINSFFKKYNT